MKKIFYSIFVLSGLFMSACSQDAKEDSIAETRLMVNLSTDLTFANSNPSAKATGSAVKRAVDENAYKNITNYTVTLTKTATNEIIHTAQYGDWDLAYMVEPNVEYKLTASYGNEVPASYNDLLVSGSETFTVQPGATKKVDFQCVPKAVKVNVNYSDDFQNYYSDCAVSIETKYMTEGAWTMSKADEGKDLYLKADEQGEPITLSFDLRDKQGNSIKPEGFPTTKTVTVLPKTLLKVTLKPNVTEIAGGKVGLSITVDTGVEDENVDIEIPNTIFQ